MTKFFDNVNNATRIDAYDDTYARMQHIFDNSHFGNIPKSMGAVADITGIDQPPPAFRHQYRRTDLGARYPGRPTRRIRPVGTHHQRNRLTSLQVSHRGGSCSSPGRIRPRASKRESPTYLSLTRDKTQPNLGQVASISTVP